MPALSFSPIPTVNPHNTITPIARMREGGAFELDLVLRTISPPRPIQWVSIIPIPSRTNKKGKYRPDRGQVGLAVLPPGLRGDGLPAHTLVNGGDLWAKFQTWPSMLFGQSSF